MADWRLLVDIAADMALTDSQGDITVVQVKFGPVGGTLTNLGSFQSHGKNSGIYTDPNGMECGNWRTLVLDANSVYNPAVDNRCRLGYVGGNDASRVSSIRLLDIVSGQTISGEYPSGCRWPAWQSVIKHYFTLNEGNMTGSSFILHRCNNVQDLSPFGTEIEFFFSVTPVCPCLSPPAGADSGWGRVFF